MMPENLKSACKKTDSKLVHHKIFIMSHIFIKHSEQPCLKI